MSAVMDSRAAKPPAGASEEKDSRAASGDELAHDEAAMLKEQEAMLMAKYPGLCGHGKSKILQRKLSTKGVKYFDSGDYAMAQAKGGVLAKQPATGQPDNPESASGVGGLGPHPPLCTQSSDSGEGGRDDDAPPLPVPTSVLLKKRGSLQQQISITGELIATPECIPQRKMSLTVKRQATIS